MEDNKDKRLDYRPDIKYEDDYYSDKAFREKHREEQKDEEDDDLYDEDFMDSLQDDIDHLAELIPMLPIDLQTAVNQVFKPVFNDWYDNLKGRLYPTRIPDPDKPIIRPTTPGGGGSGGSTPGNGGGSSGGGDMPSGGDSGGGNPSDPGGGGDPNTNPPTTNGRDFGDMEIEPDRPPTIYTPDPQEPVIPEPEPVDTPEYIGDDDIFAPSSPFTIEYEDIDPLEKIELEYTKNIADLYDYYLNKLKNALHKFYLGLVGAVYGANKETGADCAKFILEDIQLADTNVEGGLRHLIDTGLRGEVTGSLKLSFCINMFPIESTLYHMKDFKVAKELRTRYESEEMMQDGTRDGSVSDRILQGMRETYDKKYDTSYINLYKYLNSSVDVLDDVLRTLMMGIRAKEILLKKGGTSE